MGKILKQSMIFYILLALASLLYTVIAQFTYFFSLNFWLQTILILSVIPVISGYYFRNKFWESMKISTVAVFSSVIISYLLGAVFYSFHIYSYFVEGVRNSSPVMSIFLGVCRPYLLAEQVAILNEGNIAAEACPLAALNKTFMIIIFIIIAILLVAGFMSLGKRIRSIS